MDYFFYQRDPSNATSIEEVCRLQGSILVFLWTFQSTLVHPPIYICIYIYRGCAYVYMLSVWKKQNKNALSNLQVVSIFLSVRGLSFVQRVLKPDPFAAADSHHTQFPVTLGLQTTPPKNRYPLLDQIFGRLVISCNEIGGHCLRKKGNCLQGNSVNKRLIRRKIWERRSNNKNWRTKNSVKSHAINLCSKIDDDNRNRKTNSSERRFKW